MINATGIIHIAHNENPGIWYDLISTKAVIALPFDSHDAVMVRMNKGIELGKRNHNIIANAISGKVDKIDDMHIRTIIHEVRCAGAIFVGKGR